MFFLGQVDRIDYTSSQLFIFCINRKPDRVIDLAKGPEVKGRWYKLKVSKYGQKFWLTGKSNIPFC